MTDRKPRHIIDPVPNLYALHRQEDGDEPAGVVAWGLAFADGSAITLWTDPYVGAFSAFGSLQMVEVHHAPHADAELVWLTGPTSPS